jgi:hypothetical protein
MFFDLYVTRQTQTRFPCLSGDHSRNFSVSKTLMRIPPMLFQLAYVSMSRLALDETTLSDILEASRRNNARDEITGILMHHDKIFFQVLEGDRSAVEKCYYERIGRDRRHISLSLMWTDVVKSRTFSDWAMGYAGPYEIGRYTKSSFQSLSYLKSDEAVAANTNEVTLELARLMFSDFKKRV